MIKFSYMSYIAEILKKKYLDNIKTTKDLVYKDKVVDVHNPKKSYEKMAAEHKLYKSTIKFADNHYYININKEFEGILDLHVKLIKKTKGLTSEQEVVDTNINSEIFNSLWVEGVKSSKKVIKQIVKNKKVDLTDETSKIAFNFYDALKFVFTTKSISEQTMFALYQILSRDIEMGEEKLDGYPYRQEDVHIGEEGVKGISPDLIKKAMDSMFEDIAMMEKEPIKNISHFINALLFHYHFEIVHPYYDMNGRMGRLLSLWYAAKFNFNFELAFLSEAINWFKEEFYYNAFKASDFNGFKFDATYFIASVILATCGQKIAFLLVNQMEEKVKKEKQKILSQLQKDIIMSLFTKDQDKYYTIQQFLLGVDEINPAQVSLALSELVEFGIIEEIESKPKQYKIIWSDEISKCIAFLTK